MLSTNIIHENIFPFIDWLREMQFSGNSVQTKRYFSVKDVTNHTGILIGQRKPQIANQILAQDSAFFAAD